MSSPFSVFRKYQSQLMVIFGVILMVVFVVGSVIMQALDERRRPQTGANEVVLTWAGGKMRRSELQTMQRRRLQTYRFMAEVIKQTVKDHHGTPRGEGVTPQRESEFQFVPAIPADGSPQSVVTTMLLAKKAAQMGIVIDDVEIHSLLDDLCDHSLGDKELQTVLHDVSNRELTPRLLIEQLKTEIASRRVQQLFELTLVSTPEQFWEYHHRLRRQVKIEYVRFPASDFLDQVKQDAPPGEVERLYQEGKERYSNPASPEVAFARRPQAEFQYLKADHKRFVEESLPEAREAIGDEQIQQEYEQNQKRYTVKEPKKEAEPAKDSDESTSPDAEKTDKNPATPRGEPETGPTDAPDSPEKPDAPRKEDGTPESESQGARTSPPTTYFVSQDRDAPGAEAIADPPADEQPPAPKENPRSDDAQDGAPGAAGQDEKPAPKIRPLDDELRAEIKEELAKIKAQELATTRRRKALDEVNRRLLSFSTAYKKSQVTKETVTPPDFEELAKKHSLTAGRTALTDALGIADEELGKAEEISIDPTGRGLVRISFAQRGFDPNLNLFTPDRMHGADFDTEFIYWKVAEKPARVPELSEVRQEAIDAWRLREAMKLARKQAQELAERGNKQRTGKMIELFDEPPEVHESETFSWLTVGNLSLSSNAMPRLSPVTGIEYAGESFMESVFKLQAGEYGVAANEPQTEAYLVRLADDVNSEEDLRDAFLEGPPAVAARQLAAIDMQRSGIDWFENLRKELRVTWLQQPADEAE